MIPFAIRDCCSHCFWTQSSKRKRTQVHIFSFLLWSPSTSDHTPWTFWSLRSSWCACLLQTLNRHRSLVHRPSQELASASTHRPHQSGIATSLSCAQQALTAGGAHPHPRNIEGRSVAEQSSSAHMQRFSPCAQPRSRTRPPCSSQRYQPRWRMPARNLSGNNGAIVRPRSILHASCSWDHRSAVYPRRGAARHAVNKRR